MSNMNTREKIFLTLTDRLEAQFVDIKDESVKHVGHKSAKESGGGHYDAIIVSSHFEGKATLARHRLIYEALQKEFSREIHALSIKAYTPEEWNKLL